MNFSFFGFSAWPVRTRRALVTNCSLVGALHLLAGVKMCVCIVETSGWNMSALLGEPENEREVERDRQREREGTSAQSPQFVLLLNNILFNKWLNLAMFINNSVTSNPLADSRWAGGDSAESKEMEAAQECYTYASLMRTAVLSSPGFCDFFWVAIALKDAKQVGRGGGRALWQRSTGADNLTPWHWHLPIRPAR